MPFIRINTSFKLLASLLLAAVCTFISCVEVMDDGAEATGALVPVSVSFDVTVDELVETKAIALPEISAPAVDQILYVVKDKNGKTVYSAKGLWKENLIIPVGQYTVEASFNDNGFGEPAFAGSATGTVEPYEQESVTLTLQVVNALVAVSVDSELTGHFTPDSKVTFTSDGKSYDSSLGEYCFVPSGKPLDLKLSGTNSVGKPSVFEYTLQSPSPRSACEVICGKASTNWPAVTLDQTNVAAWATRIYVTSPATCSGSISEANKVIVYEAIPSSSSDWSNAQTAVVDNGVPVFKKLVQGTEYQVRARIGALVSNAVRVTPNFTGLTTTAEHTKTSDELDGTDVTVSFTHSSAAVKSSIKSWTMNLCDSNGKVLRSGLQPGVKSDGSAITAKDGWPYLPADKGESYKICASVTMMDGEVISYPDVVCAVPPTPDFTVSMKSYTSYDKYAGTNGVTKSVSEANSCDPSTIYNVGASWGISLNLMNNTNYLKTLVITDNGTQLQKYEVTEYNSYYYDQGGREWRAHELQASVTIAGKTCSATRTHHVTGLPYKPAAMVEADWSLASWNCEYSGGTIQLGGVSGSGEASATSNMKFHIPSSVGVKLNTNVTVRAYYLVLWYNTDFSVQVNGTTIINQNSNKQDNDNTGKNYSLSATSTFTPTGSSVKLNSSYTLAGPWSKVHSLQILYN